MLLQVRFDRADGANLLPQRATFDFGVSDSDLLLALDRDDELMIR